jgi:hypothetical protein
MQREDSKVSDNCNVANALLMLILDVRTRWASTHQMLCVLPFLFIVPGSQTAGRTLDYRDTIDSFVSRNKELHSLELSDDDWESIKLVALWLKSFRSATVEMSTTKIPMLSTTHAIFRGLQDDIKDIIHHLPDSISPGIRLGLTEAHCKLSNYYYLYDASPFYTWAACTWFIIVAYLTS